MNILSSSSLALYYKVLKIYLQCYTFIEKINNQTLNFTKVLPMIKALLRSRSLHKII